MKLNTMGFPTVNAPESRDHSPCNALQSFFNILLNEFEGKPDIILPPNPTLAFHDLCVVGKRDVDDDDIVRGKLIGTRGFNERAAQADVFHVAPVNPVGMSKDDRWFILFTLEGSFRPVFQNSVFD